MKKGVRFGVASFFVILICIFSSGSSFQVSVSNDKEIYGGSGLEVDVRGFVCDPVGTPIEGVSVRVYFHGTYLEDFTNATGFYHIFHIPVCNCTKLISASKPNHTINETSMGLYGSVILNFTIAPLNPSWYTQIHGTHGNNEWFVSPVRVSFVVNPMIVAAVYLNGEIYCSPVVIDIDGYYNCEVLIEYIDGNYSDPNIVSFKIDTMGPVIDLTWESLGSGTYWVKLTGTCFDELSGVDYVDFYREYYTGYERLGTDVDSPYECITTLMPMAPVKIVGYVFFPFNLLDYFSVFCFLCVMEGMNWSPGCYCFDKAGNYDLDSIGVVEPTCHVFLQKLVFENKYTGNMSFFHIDAEFELPPLEMR